MYCHFWLVLSIIFVLPSDASTRLKMIDKLYCKSLLAMPVSDEIKTDAVRQWAKIVTDARHPEQVFEVVPDAIKQEHEDITYVTVRWQKQRYIWATKEEAGVTHVHPTAWGEVIGVME